MASRRRTWLPCRILITIMFARHALLEHVRGRNWIQHVLLVRFMFSTSFTATNKTMPCTHVDLIALIAPQSRILMAVASGQIRTAKSGSGTGAAVAAVGGGG